jgi:hypothetical protein
MTEKEYQEKLDFLIKNLPNEPLLQVCKGGYSAINTLYINKLMQRYIATQAVETQDDYRTPNEFRDENLNKMLVAKYALSKKIRLTSNQFHECHTDAERGEVSDTLTELEENYKQLLSDISYYDTFRMMRERVDKPDFYDIPATEGGLLSALLSARSNLSIIKKDLRNMPQEAMYDEKHPQHKRYKALEEKRVKFDKKIKILSDEKERRGI